MQESSLLTVLLFTVTDTQLVTTKYVTLILLILIFGGLFFNLWQLVLALKYRTRLRRALYSTVLFSLIFPVYATYQEESTLLDSNKFVPGTTVRFCNEFMLGSGVEFTYAVDGETYINCNTFHPIPKDSLAVPNGKYLVRYSDQYPERGRINLRMPVIIEGMTESLVHDLSEPLKARTTKPIPSK